MNKLIKDEKELTEKKKYNVAGQDLEYKGVVKCELKGNACPKDCKGLILFGDRHECFRNLSDNELAKDIISEKVVI